MIRVSQSSNNLQIEIFLILSHARLAFFFASQLHSNFHRRGIIIGSLIVFFMRCSIPSCLTNLIHAADNGKGLLSSREEKGEQVRESKRYKMCLDVHSGSLST